MTTPLLQTPLEIISSDYLSNNNNYMINCVGLPTSGAAVAAGQQELLHDAVKIAVLGANISTLFGALATGSWAKAITSGVAAESTAQNLWNTGLDANARAALCSDFDSIGRGLAMYASSEPGDATPKSASASESAKSAALILATLIPQPPPGYVMPTFHS